MSQKAQADGAQKHFPVGRGLLAAAENLNFNMNEQRPSRPMGVGGGGMEGQDSGGQMPRRGGGSNLGSTMKLFASLGLSPSDLDALAEIPEEEISVETLPRILMQLKSRKGEAGERRAVMSSDAAYRGGSWEEGHVGRMGGPSLGQGSAKSTADFGYGSLQDVSSSRGYGLNYGGGSGGGGGGGSRERPYSELSHHGGLGMGPSEPVFMQRRMGSPSNGKVQDFLGVMPPMFPHVCSLCDFDVHSTMEWNQHINGLRHAENRRLLLGMYPEWDPGVGSGRGGRPWETPNLSAGLLGPAPMSAGPMGEMSSSWGGGGAGGLLGQNKLRSRVVVVKYDRKPLSDKSLFAFAERFSRLREHLILKNKAFLEMSTHEEAQDVVDYYKQHPASLYGKPVTFYLSETLMFIEKGERPLDRPTTQRMDQPIDRPVREVESQGSKVVFFYHLPREDEKKQELLKLAEHFGVVEKHLFLTDRAFIQLGSVEDAEMLVKYYTQNPLVFNGRLVRLNICTKYKTLNVNHKQGKPGGDTSSRKNGKAGSTSSNSKASSSTKTREENKEEEKVKAAVEEEEVSGVMDGEEEQASDGKEARAPDEEEARAPDEEEARAPDEEEARAPDEEEERAECVKKTDKDSWNASQEEEEEKTEEEKVADEVTHDTLGDVGELGDAKQGAESEGQMEAAETEASTKEHEVEEEANMEAAEGDIPEEEDFPENIEDFVTLDELEEDEDEGQGESDDTDTARRGGMRVVNIVGFRRGYQYLNELLRLAQPFGKVVKHLVLDLRPEAFLQFATEEEARAMASFYNGNITASVCGRPVKISHSLSYPTIQSGSSKVVYIGQIPNTKYSEKEILKLAEPYGNVNKYFLNRIRRECFLEMYKAEDAEKMAADYKVKPLRFSGKRLTLYVSRKYKQLKHGHRAPRTKKRANDSLAPKSSHDTEEPPDKKSKEEAKPEEQKRQEEVESSDVSGEQMATDEKLAVKKEEQMETWTDQDGQAEAPPPPAENIPSAASLPLPPYDPTTPIGVEHVKAGFYCRICFLFYSNEDTAKKTHCSSHTHYDKLKKYLEKEQSKTEEEVTTT